MRSILVGLVVALCATTAHAQTIFTMNDDGTINTGWPNGAVPNNTMHTRVHLPNGGRDGGPAWELRQIPGGGGENYWGWNGDIEASDPPRNQSRFIRFYWFGALGSTTGTNKVLMVGDGCRALGPRCRVILTYRASPINPNRLRWSLVIDGGDTPANYPAADEFPSDQGVTLGVWHEIQLELKPSSSASANDGYYKMWIDSNDYSQPTAQWASMVLNPYRWRSVFLGAYQNTALPTGHANSFRVQGFRVSTSFNGSVPPPPPPDPVDCEVSAFALSAFDNWSACSAGTQTRQETWTRTVTQQPANGGAACPALVETRTGSQSCTPPPPPPPLTTTIRMDCTRIVSITRNADYANGDQRWTVRGQCVETSAGVVAGPPTR